MSFFFIIIVREGNVGWHRDPFQPKSEWKSLEREGKKKQDKKECES